MSKKANRNSVPEVETENEAELTQSEAELVEVAEVQDEVVKTTKKLGIGKRIVELLKSGIEPKVVLEEILKEFNSKTTIACVYWYKSKINKGFY